MKADGVFLWVNFAIDECKAAVVNGDSKEELHSRLEKVPSTLDQCYDRILHQLYSGDYKDECRHILSLVACACRPLSLTEAFSLLTSGNPSNTASMTLSERRLRSRCGGLVEVTAEGSLRFIHETVRAFLFTSAVTARIGASYGWGIADGHRKIMEGCLRVVADPSLSLPSSLLYGDRFDVRSDLERLYERFPLLEYAVSNWIHHWRECETTKTQYDESMLLEWSNGSEFLI